MKVIVSILTAMLFCFSASAQRSVSVDVNGLLQNPIGFFNVNSNYLNQGGSRITWANTTATRLRAMLTFTNEGTSELIGTVTARTNVVVAGTNEVTWLRLTTGGSANSLAKVNAAGLVTVGQLLTPEITDGAVTKQKFENVAASRLLGNPSGVAGAMVEIPVGSGLSFSAGSLIATGGGGGEANTSSNTGDGVGIANAKVGVDLSYKSFKSGNAFATWQTNATNITLTINQTGETNTVSNLGTQGSLIQGLFASKSGVDLRFRSIEAAAGGGIVLFSNANTLIVSNGIIATGTGILTNSGSGTNNYFVAPTSVNETNFATSTMAHVKVNGAFIIPAVTNSLNVFTVTTNVLQRFLRTTNFTVIFSGTPVDGSRFQLEVWNTGVTNLIAAFTDTIKSVPQGEAVITEIPCFSNSLTRINAHYVSGDWLVSTEGKELYAVDLGPNIAIGHVLAVHSLFPLVITNTVGGGGGGGASFSRSTNTVLVSTSATNLNTLIGPNLEVLSTNNSGAGRVDERWTVKQTISTNGAVVGVQTQRNLIIGPNLIVRLTNNATTGALDEYVEATGVDRWVTNASFTATTNYNIYGWSAVAVAGTIILPNAIASSNFTLVFKDEGGNATATNILISGIGPTYTNLIDGVTNRSITANFGSLMLYSGGGSNWYVISHYVGTNTTDKFISGDYTFRSPAGGSGNFATLNAGTLTVTNALEALGLANNPGSLKLHDTNHTLYVAISAPVVMASNLNLVLPSNAPIAGQNILAPVGQSGTNIILGWGTDALGAAGTVWRFSTNGVLVRDTTNVNVIINSGTLVTNNTTDGRVDLDLSGILASATLFQDSANVPMGAWFTNGQASPATAFSFTNVSDAFVFANAATNTIRLLFTPPVGWDASVVRVSIRGLCTGTNDPSATNVVWSVRAAAIKNGEDATAPTFGTAVTVTNRISVDANKSRACVINDLTIGNTPAGTNAVLWEISRIGDATGDSETNSSVAIIDTKIFYKRNLAGTWPAPTE